MLTAFSAICIAMRQQESVLDEILTYLKNSEAFNKAKITFFNI